MSKIRDLICSLRMTSFPEENLIKYLICNKPKMSAFEERLIEVFQQYVKILKFTNAFQDAEANDAKFLKFENNKIIGNGIYLKAFVSGILDVKMTFNEDLTEMEESILINPFSVISTSFYSLLRMYEVFLYINEFIDHIIDNELSGCQILDVCYRRKNETPGITHLINRLVMELQVVMIRQVKGWVLYGILEDDFQEFFIREHATLGSLDNQLESILSRSSIMFSDTLMNSSSFASLPFTLKPSNREYSYHMEASLVPSHLSYSVVNKILSAGKYVILMKNSPSSGVPGVFSCIDTSDYGVDEKEVLTTFRKLEENEVFDCHTFEKVIDDIWLSLNKYLRKLADDVGDFKGQYKIVGDIFLFGRGELFIEFLNRASYMLSSDASTVHTRALNQALESAAYDLYRTENFKLLERFQITLPPSREISKGSLTKNVMKLNYKTPWPLHLIFSKEILDDYNTIFLFLLNLRSCHKELLSVWFHVSKSSQESFRQPMNHLYHRLNTVITSLQDYIFVDVILYEKGKLEQMVSSSEMFDEVQVAHAAFVSNIMTQLFLTKGPSSQNFLNIDANQSHLKNTVDLVQNEFKKLFSIIGQFCCFVKEDKVDCLFFMNQLKKLRVQFDKLMTDMLSLMSKMNEKYSEEYIGRLIARLDWNNYFAKVLETGKSS